MIATALDDGGLSNGWWYDADTGMVAIGELGGEPFDENGDPQTDEDHGLVPIDPAGSKQGYQDMVDFVEAVGDRVMSERLHQALRGRGETIARLRHTFNRTCRRFLGRLDRRCNGGAATQLLLWRSMSAR